VATAVLTKVWFPVDALWAVTPAVLPTTSKTSSSGGQEMVDGQQPEGGPQPLADRQISANLEIAIELRERRGRVLFGFVGRREPLSPARRRSGHHRDARFEPAGPGL